MKELATIQTSVKPTVQEYTEYLSPIVVDIYCRVSTDDQEDNTSLNEQEKASRQYCKDNNLIVGKVHREVYSGYMYREREKLSLMRERYLSGKIQGVVVRTYDRLSRKEVHLGILLEEMEHQNIQLHCVKEVLEDTLVGRMTRLFLGFLAEWEWEKIRERTTTGRINAAKDGKVVGGCKLPYGWRWQMNAKGEKEKIVRHETHAWVVRWIVIKFVRGTSIIEITRQLSERGIPTPEGEEGAKWDRIMVRRILWNKRLTGRAQNFGNYPSKAKNPLEPADLPEGTHPPLISEGVFHKIQERLVRNKDESSRRSSRPEAFLLRAGYIRCGICGRKMNTRIDKNIKKHSMRPRKVQKTRNGELMPIDDSLRGTPIERLLYRCKSEDNRGETACCGQELPAKEVDAWTWGELQKLADHVDLIKTVIDLVASTNATESEARAIDASLAAWKQKAQNYLEDLEDVTLRGDSRASIRQSLNTANQHIEQLESERAIVLLGMIDYERERVAYMEILEWCQTVKESRGELTYQRKRDFLHMLGLVAIAKRDKEGKLDCKMEIELPKIQELIMQSTDFGDHYQAILYGSEHIALGAGSL